MIESKDDARKRGVKSPDRAEAVMLAFAEVPYAEPRIRSFHSEENTMKIEMRLTIKIIPFARNARKIPQQAIDKVAASIQEFSFRQPIVVDKDGVIVCGHTRWLAAQKLGLEQVPVHVAENLTPAQVRAYRLLDNRSHEETSWDEDLLGLELLDLKGMGIDLDLTGFDMSEIDDLLSRIDIQAG